ncbi:Uncharacterized protein dnl_57820 [Desulfonema limicola]|uniref:Uncharacterized protein n=1 Tax=Desulfonema limicola TaxID=45656 RepID=A0A975BDL5_9BACT|nr:hypothetical protein [Desulfonema limicola]QTA83378.1 Uncharacterized protein dnl_57820 [Desulfonema limicola]
MKKFWVLTIVFFAVLCLTAPVWSQDDQNKKIEDITEEVLSGPSDLNPEKILGPGGIGIKTHKDLLMSFGATVRFIPTQETDYDFGMSESVPGYFYTEGVKAFANSAMTSASAASNVYTSSIAINNAIAADRGIRSAFDEYANSLYQANSVLGAAVKPAADGAAQIQSAANAAATLATGQTATLYTTALTAGKIASQTYEAAIKAKDMAVAGEALAAIASDKDYQAAVAAQNLAAAQARAAAVATPYVMKAALNAAKTQAGDSGAAALQAVFADPDYQAAMAAGNTAAAEAAAQAVVVKAAGAAGDTAASGVIKDKAAPVIAGGDTIAASAAAKITGNPDAVAANIMDAVAYTTALNAKVQAFSPYYLATSFLKTHSNESGSVNDGYFRTETKLFFNAMPKDKKWSFYAALEYDKPIDTNTVDNRGGKDGDSSNFGLERLNASIELVDGLRLHGGWDIWGMDVIEAASMVYGDDNAGFWLNGKYNPVDFSIAWIKLQENDFQNGPADHTSSNDADRDLIAGYMDYKFRENDKVRFFYGFDRIRSVPSLDLTAAIASEAGLQDYAGIYGNNGINGADAASPEIDAHTIGAYYLGHYNIIELMLEGAYKFGSADDTGLAGVDNGVNTIKFNDFDISSYAVAADIGFELKDMVGWHSFKPHMGFTYTSGDDDPNDDKLSGYSGITNAQRFSRMWGGENTIIGDTNLVLGTALYGYIPELYGNGTPVFVGGLQNMAGMGNGRGDNPGLTMYSLGITVRPKIYLIYRTNANVFYWNEDFYVGNMVEPVTVDASGLKKQRYTLVAAGYVGTEWDNEITLALSQNMFIKTQASLFFPGEAVEDVTFALSGGREKSDSIASRLALELIWNF